MKQYSEQSLRGPTSLYARVLLILMLIMLIMACLPDCGKKKVKKSTQTSQVTPPTVYCPKMQITCVSSPGGYRTTCKVKCTSTSPTAKQIWLKWDIPKGASNVQISYDGKNCSGAFVMWYLPVGTNGQTDEVTIVYDRPPGVDKVVDKFEALHWPGPSSDSSSTNRAVTTERAPFDKGWGEWSPASPPAPTGAGATAARHPALQDDYTLWETTTWYGADGLTVTVDLCQDTVDVLQSDTAFVALRFPAQPPPLAYTDPYTLPVSFRSDASPYLFLLDERAWPHTPVITTALEYKPQYLTFAENELPPAPGEHWLTLGAVISPTIDCAGLPELPAGEWEVQAQVWLDFGGVPDTCDGCVLPLYYCYKGQQLPAQMSRALGINVTSYQGWDITCVGPHYLTLHDGRPDWELAGQGGAWITPTQTISFTHKIYNRTRPRTSLIVNLELSSTLDAGWAVYADEQGQTPVTGPFRVDDSVRYFWLFGQVPADAADGPYSLIVTARTDDAPPALQQASDLMWVGDWVSPPPGPFWFRIYLPVVVKSDS